VNLRAETKHFYTIKHSDSLHVFSFEQGLFQGNVVLTITLGSYFIQVLLS